MPLDLSGNISPISSHGMGPNLVARELKRLSWLVLPRWEGDDEHNESNERGESWRGGVGMIMTAQGGQADQHPSAGDAQEHLPNINRSKIETLSLIPSDQVNKRVGENCSKNVDNSQNYCRNVRRPRAGVWEDRDGVEHYSVDAWELLENHHQDADCDRFDVSKNIQPWRVIRSFKHCGILCFCLHFFQFVWILKYKQIS